MLKIPSSMSDLEAMILSQTQESIHLDYKASAALTGKRDELSKDVSAFANSDGGVIVFGIEEEGHLPIRVDSGVANSALNREQLESLIQSNVAPRIEDLTIVQIPVSATHSAYAIAVSRSERAPHQDRKTNRYYKRYNFKSEPMEDYEIQDVRNRIKRAQRLVFVDVEVDQGNLFVLSVENVGNVAATDLQFSFSEEIEWAHGKPAAFSGGMPVLSRGRKLSFYYGVSHQVLSADSKQAKKFTVSVTYTDPTAPNRVSDSFDIDLTAFGHSLTNRSDLYRHGKSIEDAILKLAEKTDRIGKYLESLMPMAGPTGLDLSFSTLRNIGRLTRGEIMMPQYDPRTCNYQAFQEVLGINLALAIRIRDHFARGREESKIDEINGMNNDIKDRLRTYFGVAE